MSISSRHKRQVELASFHSAFVADDTLVEVVPSFDYPRCVSLLSSSTAVGPFKAGIATHVPLWLAMMLRQKSLCTLQVPEWLQPDHLTQIKQYETNVSKLTPSEEAIDNDDHDTPKATLPFYYYELGQRFTSAKTTAHNTDMAASQAPQASNLLLQDIAQIRLDKIRQQFQQVSREQMSNPNVCLEVTGIASAELVQMKGLITQALNDQRFLASSAASANAQKKHKDTATAAGSSGRSHLEREQKEVEEDNDERTPPAARSANPLRNRTRRFRG